MKNEINELEQTIQALKNARESRVYAYNHMGIELDPEDEAQVDKLIEELQREIERLQQES